MARGFSHQFSPIINRRPNAHCTGQEQQSVHTCTYSALGRSSSQFTHMYIQCTGQEQQSVHTCTYSALGRSSSQFTHVHTVHWAGAYSATISGTDLGEGHGQALG